MFSTGKILGECGSYRLSPSYLAHRIVIITLRWCCRRPATVRLPSWPRGDGRCHGVPDHGVSDHGRGTRCPPPNGRRWRRPSACCSQMCALRSYGRAPSMRLSCRAVQGAQWRIFDGRVIFYWKVHLNQAEKILQHFRISLNA
jgi:hypothetical protein